MNARVEQAIFDIASQQHGVVTRRQLMRAGLSCKVVKARVASKRLRLVFRGVYQASPILSPEARHLAAVLACGPGACLSHFSAAGRAWKIIAAGGHESPVDVTIPADQRRGCRPGIRIHRARYLPPEEVTILKGIPITTPARTLLDLAPLLDARALEQALATAERLELLLRSDLQPLCDRRGRVYGGSLLRHLISSDSELAFTRSEAEERLLAIIERADLPRPRLNARVGRYQVDFLFRIQKVIVEVDGFAFHSSKRMFEGDRSRDVELQSRGFRILRITWEQLSRQSEVVLVRLARTLALAEGAPD